MRACSAARSWPPGGAHHCLVLGPDDGMSMWNKSGAPLRFPLVGGQPLGERVVQHGPFVMNSPAEIQQAMEYYYGNNGFERLGSGHPPLRLIQREIDTRKKKKIDVFHHIWIEQSRPIHSVL
ncbi:hypothetical protein PVAP13_1NG381919 [Panicum virgatum]|uniref:Pirin C-terminal domain-containing protein n=1 Tax=Panicum virgatum TaxID=38727 RepID=A0A8T0X200_PANVG|nr:hypothetical protein PVAP13_1NG381919 [Panicum virgatum]